MGALLTTVALGFGRAGSADVIGALLVAAGVAIGFRQPGRVSTSRSDPDERC
ncbi:hypothetical protein ACFU9B_12515 [Streptomyces sp. NPDC057592]|uniref:hypothetical protein n=1 Tax=Streptomyces sp. NPDC057592 TaxID=3346175 RepID=UPI00368FE808